MKERLAELILSKGLTSSKFAELLEVQPSSISHILSGRNNPSYDFILKILKIFTDVDPDWLLLGEGAMYRVLNSAYEAEFKAKTVAIDEDRFSHDDVPISMELDDSLQPTVGLEQGDPYLADRVESDNAVMVTSVKSNKKIERIVVFYSDKSFSEYTPE